MKKGLIFSKILISVILMNVKSNALCAQSQWTRDEVQFYNKMKLMCEYYSKNKYDTANREYAFREFVYFDNILKDTSELRKRERIVFFDGLFITMMTFIDSVGVNNLDAAPTRQFQNNTDFFQPFKSDGELFELLPQTLTYFDKRKPDKPLGVLLFEKHSHKLLAWVLINQGGYRYFLTFNLV